MVLEWTGKTEYDSYHLIYKGNIVGGIYEREKGYLISSFLIHTKEDYGLVETLEIAKLKLEKIIMRRISCDCRPFFPTDYDKGINPYWIK